MHELLWERRKSRLAASLTAGLSPPYQACLTGYQACLTGSQAVFHVMHGRNSPGTQIGDGFPIRLENKRVFLVA